MASETADIRCLLWFTWFVVPQETQMTVVATSKPVVLYSISPMHVPVPPLVHPVSTISNESDVLINDEQNCPILWENATVGVNYSLSGWSVFFERLSAVVHPFEKKTRLFLSA